MIEIIKKYPGYKVLAEDASTLEFKQLNNIKEIEIEKYFKIYEIDHDAKVVYLEAKQVKPAILITSGDDLELPLAVVNNFNQAAEVLNVEATHLYRAWRNAGKPSRLTYKDYILIKI